MDTAKRIEQLVVSNFTAAMRASPGEDGKYRTLLMFKVGDSMKPLLLVGTTHGIHEDGSSIAILNPDEDLLDKVHAGVGYTEFILKEIVAKRCDLMLWVFLKSYRENPVDCVVTYQSRAIKPAKFVVR